MQRPKVVAFDIIETTFRIEPLGDRLAVLGLPASSYARLYAEALRDAVSLACIGRFAPFTEIFAGQLAILLAEAGLSASDEAIREALSVMRELPPHPDAPDAYARLAEAGVKVVALSNGAEAATRALLDRAGMTASVEHILSVDTVRLAKPRREVYRLALEAAGSGPDDTMLVACHPWDVTGAIAARLRGAYVARGKPYPGTMAKPEIAAESLAAVADAILALPA